MVAVSKKSKNSKEAGVSAEPVRLEKPLVISAQLEKQIKTKKNAKNKKKTNPERGVVFIKNLPQGFFEQQIKNYFRQFGKVTRVRLVRSKKTGFSRGFAFIEFVYPEVAEEVAKSTNNQLMFQRLIKATYIPPKEQKFNYFKSGVKPVRTFFGKLKYVSAKTKRSILKMDQVNFMGSDHLFRRMKSDLARDEEFKKKLEHMGLISAEDCVHRPLEMMTKRIGLARLTQERREGEPSSDDEDREKNEYLRKKLKENGAIFDENTGKLIGEPPKFKASHPYIPGSDELSDDDLVHNKKYSKDKVGENEKSNDGENDEEKSTPGSILLTKKRKPSLEEESKKSKNKGKVFKSEIGIEDILKQDFDDDDSDDDDFIPIVEHEEDSENDSKSSDDNEFGEESTMQIQSESSSESEDEIENRPRNYVQIMKPLKKDSNEKILKRNPHSGSVQKSSKIRNKGKISIKKEKIKLAEPTKIERMMLIKRNVKKIHKKGKQNGHQL